MNDEQTKRLADIEQRLESAVLPEDHREAITQLHHFMVEIVDAAKERRAKTIIKDLWRGRLTVIGAALSVIALFRKELGALLEHIL